MGYVGIVERKLSTYIGWSIHYLFHGTMDVILPLKESIRFFLKPVVVKRVNSKQVISTEPYKVILFIRKSNAI